MNIYIPTMRRERLQYTLAAIRSESLFPIILVTPYEEWGTYRNQISRSENVTIVSTPEHVKGIAATRQWIMEQATDNHVLMMDDDLSFAVRRTDDPTRFREPESGEIRDMLQKLDDMLMIFPHIGLATREGGNRNTEPVLIATRAPRVIGFRRDVFMQEGVDFRNSIVQDDFEAALHLLTRGHPNGVLNSFVQNQKGSGTAGGASVYRTMELHAESCRRLQARYPDFVKLVEKTTKTAWGGATRTDVVIQWKKALEYGRKTHGTPH